jgi:phosphoglycerate dehydrogenase-like enzyme
VVLTPHISAGTRDAMRQKMAAVFANLRRFFNGEPLVNQVTFLSD